MGLVRTRTILGGCVLVAIASAAYFGDAPVEAKASQAVSAGIVATRRVLWSLPIAPSPSPRPVEGVGNDQVDQHTLHHQGMSPAERRALIKQLMADAARRHGLDPGLVMAVGWWESGWDMTMVSDTGAVGIMQIDPATADQLGPELLHRRVDPHDLMDNIELGAAVLQSDLQDSQGNVDVALASYYEGGGNVNPAGLDPNALTYVAGVKALEQQFDSGQDPSPTPL